MRFLPPVLYVASWFHGKISGPEAVKKLKPREDGLFLVRESIRHPGDYVLCVSFSGDVIHYRVIFQDSKLTIDNSQFFYNLIDMIEVGPLCNPQFSQTSYYVSPIVVNYCSMHHTRRHNIPFRHLATRPPI